MASVMNMFTNLAGETAGKNKTKLDEYFDLRGRFDRARAVLTYQEIKRREVFSAKC